MQASLYICSSQQAEKPLIRDNPEKGDKTKYNQT